MLFGKKTEQLYLALDIGSQNTKIMIFEPGKAIVRQALIKPTPEGAFEEGSIKEEEVLIDFLSQCIAELEIESEFSVIAGVSGKGLIIKKIDIPQMEESMIPEFVEIEAEQEIFYNKEEMELDYEILEGVNFKKPEASSLLVVTVLKKIVESYNNIITKSFMNCDILDTNASALFNAFEYNQKIQADKRYMLIDVGCSSTNVVIVIKNQVVFARSLPIGGDFFTKGIQRKMGIEYSEAESLKISASKGESAPQELSDLIQSELNETFAEELMACYELYHSLFPEQEIHQAYITGGASQTLNLPEHLQEKLGFPIAFFDSLSHIELNSDVAMDKEKMKPFSAVAVGLSLRTLG